MISLHVADSFCQFLHQVSKFQGMRTMLGVFCPGLLDSCAPSTVTSSFSGVCGNHTGRTREIRRHTPGVQVLFEKVTKADLPEVSTCIYYIIPIDWIRYSLGTVRIQNGLKKGVYIAHRPLQKTAAGVVANSTCLLQAFPSKNCSWKDLWHRRLGIWFSG